MPLPRTVTDTFYGDVVEMRVWQTARNEQLTQPAKYPRMHKYMSSWEEHNPNVVHVVYDDSKMDAFMRNNFNNRTYSVFANLPLPVMKADMWRYDPSCTLFFCVE